MGPGDFRKATQHPQKSTDDIPDEFFAEEYPCEALEDCPVCGGNGWIHPRIGEEIIYARVKPCPAPGCYLDQAKSYHRGKLVEKSGIIGREQTFENFDEKIAGVHQAYKAAWQIAEGVSADYKWLLIYGGVGNGKTHLLNAIANRVVERGVGVKFTTMADLLSELRMAMKDNQTDAKALEYKELPFLVVDELGLEYGTDWEKEKIDEILGARWNRGMKTVVATNRDVEELPPRLKSRFKDRRYSRYVLNQGADYRQIRK